MTAISSTGVSQNVLDAMNPAKPGATQAAAEAQDRFMKLLVTQMQNQDPLNPLDNAQVTSQLAQLSTVTGIDKLNETVQALMGNYQASQTLSAASMIGRGVFVPGSELALEEGKAIFGVDLQESADNVHVKIRSASGQLVHELDLGPQDAGSLPLSWNGETAAGTQAADGFYTFEITATRGDQVLKSASPLAFGQVVSVSTGAAGVRLHVAGAGEVALDQVRQIL